MLKLIIFIVENLKMTNSWSQGHPPCSLECTQLRWAHCLALNFTIEVFREGFNKIKKHSLMAALKTRLDDYYGGIRGVGCVKKN